MFRRTNRGKTVIENRLITAPEGQTPGVFLAVARFYLE